MKLGAKIFGILAGALLLFLLVGILLPGTWSAQVEAEFDQPPEEVFPFLNRMTEWVRWAAVPDSGSVFFGPPEGAGAGIRWDDPRYGSGEVTIRGSEPDRRVHYRVEVEGGALRTQGTLELTSQGEGCHLRWTEEGDFGWNPLLGYAARGMSASQAQAMRSALGRLRALLENG